MRTLLVGTSIVFLIMPGAQAKLNTIMYIFYVAYQSVGDPCVVVIDKGPSEVRGQVVGSNLVHQRLDVTVSSQL